MNYINSRPFNPDDYVLTDADFLRLDEPRVLGLTGHMRVRNEALTLRASLDSCLPFLDELIVTYNDSDDESEDILLEYAARYPDKVRLFWYPLEWGTSRGVMCARPWKHLAYYTNFGYTKVRYTFYIKLDADQVYFTEKMLFVRKMLFKYAKLFASGASIALNTMGGDDTLPYYEKVIAKAMARHVKSTFILSGIEACYDDDNLYVYTLENLDEKPLFNGVFKDTFLMCPNSVQRYIMQENYFEVFPHFEQFCVHLGLHWVHTGFIKRQSHTQNTRVLLLKDAGAVSWDELFKRINTKKTVDLKMHNIYKNMGRRFWDRDVSKYVTKDFYERYFVDILRIARTL